MEKHDSVPSLFKDPERLERYERQLTRCLVDVAQATNAGHGDGMLLRRWYIGHFWRELRHERGLSRQEVASRMGLPDHSKLVFLENGILDPADEDPHFLNRLAKALRQPGAVEACRAIFEAWDTDKAVNNQEEAEEAVHGLEELLEGHSHGTDSPQNSPSVAGIRHSGRPKALGLLSAIFETSRAKRQ